MDQDNYNLLVCYVRGLDARCRRDALRARVCDANVSVACFQETKLLTISQFLVCEMLGHRFTRRDINAVKRKGLDSGFMLASLVETLEGVHRSGFQHITGQECHPVG